MYPPKLIPLLLTALIAACGGPRSDGRDTQASSGAENPTVTSAVAAQDSNADQVNSQPGDAQMQTIDSFVPAGMKIVDTIRGDLTGAGRSDALVVISPLESGDEKPSKGGARTVLLLTQNASGSLQKAAENQRIVPCERCGGLAGDPYAFSRIENGVFTVSISGGSRQRWSADYVFQYSPQSSNWFLQKVERSAYDQISEEKVSKTFTSEDFGKIFFADFDPSVIQEVVLP